MKNKTKIYLAGPEVFLPDTLSYFLNAKTLCNDYGFEGLSPFDGEPIQKQGLEKAKLIFENNCRLIDDCQIVIANCNSFRGALMDDGTSFEIGYAFAKGKTIFGFIDSKDILPKLVQKKIPTKKHESGYKIDNEGYLVNEDFGNSINLMMEMAINKSGGQLVEGNLEGVLKILT